jgi:hypothetical protein
MKQKRVQKYSSKLGEKKSFRIRYDKVTQLILAYALDGHILSCPMTI